MLFISTTVIIRGFVITRLVIPQIKLAGREFATEKKKELEKQKDCNLPMVDAVLGLIVQKLHDVLIKEAEFLSGVRGQVERLHNELRWMQSFLKDADAKRLKDDGVRLWIAEIRDTSYDAEDFIDTFILKATSFKTTRRRDRFNNLFKHPTGIFKEWRHLHHFGTEIEVILTRVESISNSREKYGITTVSGEDASSSSTTNDDKELRNMRRVYPHVEDEDIIGLDEHTETLVSELMKEEGKRHVVSIFGVGGLGKTTLAKKVYNHDVIKSHFDCHAWAFISEQCSRKDVFLEILKKTSSPSDSELKMIRQMDEEELVEKLYKCLQGKRYLVVLDDIWRPEQWNILNPALPNGKMGSKVLLTTRNKRVSLHADRWSLHLEPRCLTDKESWQLFCKKAFPKDMTGTSFSLPAGLEKLGKEMSSKCGGLPLGVSVLGGLMATKRPEIDEWVIVRNSMSSHLNNGEYNVLEILALSYNCLPYHLKPCFLYCGLFPEDFEIPTKKLIQLWSAEGFLRQEGEETMEEVGERQLDELIQRCMIQIGKRGVTGRVKTCRVHDLMRDLCLLKAKEINFLGTYHHQLQEESVGKSSSTTGSSTSYKLRRYSIHSGQERYATFEHSAPHLRTLLLVHPHSKEHLYSSFSMRICYTNFRLIRVLDLWGMDIIERCKFTEIASLINLRYFGVMCNSIEEPPPSIGNLQSLETLNLRCHSNHWALPNTIWKMEQLRHLYLSHICSSGHLRLNTLRNLQILYIICAGKWIEEGSLENMSNLRKLGIRSLSRVQVKKVLDAIAVKSVNHPIRSLFLDLHPGQEFPNLESLAYCGHLLKLHLCGHMGNLQNWFPNNLTKLTFTNSELQQDPMLVLEKLSNLKILDLRRSAYLGKKMVCSERGFPQLQYLQFDYLSELEDWRIREGAMPCLKSLRIQVCNKLRNVPKGLKFLKTLQKLEIYSMPRDFSDRIVRGGGDWDIVKHISSITIRDWS